MQLRWRPLPVVMALGLVLTACGGGGPSPSAGGPSASQGPVTITQGTTDTPVSYDPAGSYDLPSWNIIYNVYDTLLTVDPGGQQPVPSVGDCTADDAKTYTCTIKDGVTFSDGSDLTAEDVKFSFDRNIAIADPNGAASLLANLKEVEVVDDHTVTFHLKADDATWPFILTTAAAAIVPDSYPAKELQPSDQAIGSGRYLIDSYRPGEQTTLAPNPEYWGDPVNTTFIIQYYDTSSTMKLALENGEIDFAYRSFTPTEVADLRQAEGLQVLDGEGAEIRYLVFNVNLEPGKELAVRKAVAYTIDRQSIVDNVYEGTVDPLWSMVPSSFAGATENFKEVFGETPNKDAAAQELQQAGVSTPVDIEIWWTPSHYGDSSADEYTEIERSLEDSGLFNVTLKSTEWEEYGEAAFTDQYPAYQLGWFPDYLDADNYLASFYASSSFLNDHYKNDKVDELIATEKSSTNPDDRIAAFQEIQQIAAEDVPIIPIWQGKQLAVVSEGVTGVENTLDAAYIFRYWLVGKQ